MADIHIVRRHDLGLEAARRLAARWAEVAGQKLDMQCRYERGALHDQVQFRRVGASGRLKVAADHFALEAKLGFLMGMFKHRIEFEIIRNLDQLLAHPEPLDAFEHGLAQYEARRRR